MAVASGAKKRIDEGGGDQTWPPTRRGGQTLADRGRLRRSLHVRADDGGFSVVSNVVYALIHQVGGVIRAKPGKALTVPMRGVKGTAREWIDKGAFILSRKQQGKSPLIVIALKRGSKKAGTEKGQLRTLFVLLKSVTIPARPYVQIGQFERDEIDHHLEAHFNPPPQSGGDQGGTADG